MTILNSYKKVVIVIGFSLFMGNVFAQEPAFKFINGKDLTVLGRASSVPAGFYHRIDSAGRVGLPQAVARLAKNSSGIMVSFKTNAKTLKLNWQVAKYNTLWNMTPMATNGVDLYGWNGKNWQYITAPLVSAKAMEDGYKATLIDNLDGAMRHYRLHLPLYAELTDLEVGVEKTAIIEKADPAFIPKKKVVIYGSSITQGASASRPGLAYPAIIARNQNLEVFNLGFSGSGKMEIELADVLGKMDADVYVLDCVPNPSPEQIRSRAVPFVKRLRQLKPNIPILMVEGIFREEANWDSARKKAVISQNQEFRNAYEQLKKEKLKGLYYIPYTELIGNDHEATIDGTHLNDLGFTRLAQRVGTELNRILSSK